MSEKKLTESVEEIFKNRRYNIPEYQRGYKWTGENIKQMLNDISKFKPSDNCFYCLQNITIIKKDDAYDVIDGQQRLTTLAILLSYLDKKELINNRLKYCIREESNEFLEKYIFCDNSEAHNFFEKYPSKLPDKQRYDRQDVFHFIQAADTINKWFEGKCKDTFKKNLLENVKLIVNDVSDNQYDGGTIERIFANLNSYKVSLTSVDLIRAILITRCDKMADNNTIADIVRINEKRVRLGWEIDNYSIWWQKDKAKLFSKFLKNENKDKNNENVDVLYSMYFNSGKEKDFKSIKDIQVDLESRTDIEKEYKDIMHFQHSIEDWFDDNEIYHYIGFLAFQGDGNLTINDLWTEWVKKNQTRDEFKKYLKKEIEKVIKPDDSDSWFENIGSYQDKKCLIPTLILMDIINITSIKENKENRRLPVGYFNNIGEDIEHIFCQTPNKDDVKELKEKIEDIKFFLKTIINDNKDYKYNKEELNKKIDDFKGDNVGDYIELFNEFHILHEIGNLLLLDPHTNRSYGNSEYLDKRIRIIKEAQEGEYIRPHTWTVFTKNFDGNKDLNTWTLEDIEKNAKYIKEEINKFFEEIK